MHTSHCQKTSPENLGYTSCLDSSCQKHRRKIQDVPCAWTFPVRNIAGKSRMNLVLGLFLSETSPENPGCTLCWDFSCQKHSWRIQDVPFAGTFPVRNMVGKSRIYLVLGLFLTVRNITGKNPGCTLCQDFSCQKQCWKIQDIPKIGTLPNLYNDSSQDLKCQGEHIIEVLNIAC